MGISRDCDDLQGNMVRKQARRSDERAQASERREGIDSDGHETELFAGSEEADFSRLQITRGSALRRWNDVIPRKGGMGSSLSMP